MNLTRLAQPPNPTDFGTNFLAWQKACYEWMNNIKVQIETDSTVNTQPIAPFVVGTYTAVNTITGTDSISNFVATLVTAMNAAGISAPTSQRS